MKTPLVGHVCRGFAVLLLTAGWLQAQEEPVGLPKAVIDGTGLGWRSLGEADFVMVNGDPDTWTWKEGAVSCKGTPVGVTRSTKQITNFELVAQWRHLKAGGNSGIFVWTSEEALTNLKPGQLPPGGIEVQVRVLAVVGGHEVARGLDTPARREDVDGDAIGLVSPALGL